MSQEKSFSLEEFIKKLGNRPRPEVIFEIIQVEKSCLENKYKVKVKLALVESEEPLDQQKKLEEFLKNCFLETSFKEPPQIGEFYKIKFFNQKPCFTFFSCVPRDQQEAIAA